MGSYSEEQLQSIFAQHGAVEDVIVRQPKKRGKGSALIIMSSLQVWIAIHRHSRSSQPVL